MYYLSFIAKKNLHILRNLHTYIFFNIFSSLKTEVKSFLNCDLIVEQSNFIKIIFIGDIRFFLDPIIIIDRRLIENDNA